MIDCGLDWLKKVWRIDPDAILITHAHPDHAFGLKDGAPCPVYATKTSWEILQRYPIDDKRIVRLRKPFAVGGITFEAFSVVHSLLAPAVGYRITAGGVAIFYVPDLVSIKQPRAALSGVQLYVGDGATIARPIIRKRDGTPIGHTTIRAQLGWCQKEGVPRAVFTHCGSQIVEGDERTLGARVRALGKERGVEAMIAYDGMELTVR